MCFIWQFFHVTAPRPSALAVAQAMLSRPSLLQKMESRGQRLRASYLCDMTPPGLGDSTLGRHTVQRAVITRLASTLAWASPQNTVQRNKSQEGSRDGSADTVLVVQVGRPDFRALEPTQMPGRCGSPPEIPQCGRQRWDSWCSELASLGALC